MSWSLGEVRALAVKAARGVEMPWGMAEEAGYAVRWLQAQGAPGAAALAQYLTWRDAGAGSTHDLCPVALGTALMDAQRGVPERLGRVRQPLLLAPFIARCLPSGMDLRWGAVCVTVSEAGLVSDATRDALLAEEADCTTARAVALVCEGTGRVPDSETEALSALETYAARTYAPATEASRAGAGAGNSDND